MASLVADVNDEVESALRFWCARLRLNAPWVEARIGLRRPSNALRKANIRRRRNVPLHESGGGAERVTGGRDV